MIQRLNQRTKKARKYVVKRTATGRVRFSLGVGLQYQLVELLTEVANLPKAPELNDLAEIVDAKCRVFAQEVLVRFNLTIYPASGEKRFVVLPSEAFTFMELLWSDPGIHYKQNLKFLLGELHQLLS
ncbi:MAG: hypothetical protein V4621_08300 [Pseudomonadota bacterium]